MFEDIVYKGKIGEPTQIEVTASHADQVDQFLSRIRSCLEINSSTLVIKETDGYQIIEKDTIDYVESQQGTLTIYCGNDTYHSRQSLVSLQEDLASHDFLRVSKFGLVRVQSICRLEVAFSGNYYAFLKNDMKITVSRRFVNELKAILGL